jgi:NAD-dependent dihydropyrimidine dehydrogenase PreA subunit
MQPPLPLPIIHSYRCTGCGDCITACPTGALAARDGKAIVAQPDKCTYCLACEEICPSEAIVLPFLVLFAEQREAIMTG